MQQAELAVVDHLVLLALAQRLDGQPQLFLDLVHRVAVQVTDACVGPQHRLCDAQFVFARREFVVGEGAGHAWFAVVAGGDLDGRLATGVARRRGVRPGCREVFAQLRGAVRDLLRGLPGQGHDGDPGDRAVGVLPGSGGVGEQLVAEVVAPGQGPQNRFVAVLAGADPVDPAVRDEHQAVGRRARRGDHVPGRVLVLDEALAERAEHLAVGEVAQRGQFAQFVGDDRYFGAGDGEVDAPVPDGVGQPPVDAVRTARDLHPGQQPQQPARGDALHLRDGLGGRGQIACRARRQTGILRLAPGAGNGLVGNRHVFATNLGNLTIGRRPEPRPFRAARPVPLAALNIDVLF